MKKFILEGHDPIPCNDLLEWGRWFETADRRVAETTIGDYWVSTVFLGLDHSFGGAVPLLFETMVFKKGSSIDLDGKRYTFWDEAEAGHNTLVEKWRQRTGA